MDEKERYEKRQEFEHDLINRRLTWLLTSQTILFTALALVLREDTIDEKYRTAFFNTISYLGIFISLAIFFAICMGALAKYISYRDERKRDDKNKVRWGVRKLITIIALIPDVLMPLGFFIAWICFRRSTLF